MWHLIFHTARLVQNPEVGFTKQLVTYAQPGSSSYKRYLALGLNQQGSPIRDRDGVEWAFMASDSTMPKNAFLSRFQGPPRQLEKFEQLILYFDGIERKLREEPFDEKEITAFMLR